MLPAVHWLKIDNRPFPKPIFVCSESDCLQTHDAVTGYYQLAEMSLLAIQCLASYRNVSKPLLPPPVIRFCDAKNSTLPLRSRQDHSLHQVCEPKVEEPMRLS